MSKNQKHKKDLAVAKSQVAAELCKEEAASGGNEKAGGCQKANAAIFVHTQRQRKSERERVRCGVYVMQAGPQ